jgi:hypothetical protein
LENGQSVGKKLELILDSMPDIDYDFEWDENKSADLSDFLDDGKRIAVVMPQSAVDVIYINSLMSNLKELYDDYDIYVFTKPEFFDFIEDHPSVHKVITYSEGIDNLHFLEGKSNHKGYFDIAFLPHYGTQRFHNYHHNGIDKTQFDLYEN